MRYPRVVGGRITIGVLGALAGCNYVFDVEPPVTPPGDVGEVPLDAPDTGCADGTREGFDLALEPRIAGCGGAWSIPGVASPRAMTCSESGDDSRNPMGFDCSIADLCAEGWHVCADLLDLHAHLAADASCSWEAQNNLDAVFFASAQPGSNAKCEPSGTDDLFGCGSLGIASDATCSPLARSSSNECTALTLGGWRCKSDPSDPLDYQREALLVTKSGTTGGGALCCKDPRGT